MGRSPIFGIPLLENQQETPDVTHNEAIVLLEIAMKGVVSVGLNTPPAGVEGAAYVLGAAPTGVWSGKANKVAVYFNGSWRFLPGLTSAGADLPIGASHEGLRVWSQADDGFYVWDGSAWGAFSAGGGGVLDQLFLPAAISAPAAADFTLTEMGPSALTKSLADQSYGVDLIVTPVAVDSLALAVLDAGDVSSDFTCEFGLSVPFAYANYLSFGIFYRDSVNDLARAVGPEGNSTRGIMSAAKYNAAGYSAADSAASVVASGVYDYRLVFLRMVRVGTNVKTYVSFDGTLWSPYQSITWTDFVTAPDQIGVFLHPNVQPDTPFTVADWPDITVKIIHAAFA